MLDNFAATLSNSPVDTNLFHAPIPHSRIETLFGEYQQARERIESLHAVIQGELGGAVSWFLSGAQRQGNYQIPSGVIRLFDIDKAMGALNAAYWRKVMDLTDVYQCMPQARRDEWDQAIVQHSTPHFERDTVEATLRQLLLTRGRFFAEKVDGVFRRLSGEHITNRPEGFGKRFIMAYVFRQDIAIPNYSAAGYIHDLREVIAKFMGRESPMHNLTNHVLHVARSDPGKWVSVDGGAWKIRAYKIGTAHIEVHPDMAWRLNCVLHELHPRAIPPEFRSKPRRKRSIPDVFDRPLPFPVLGALSEGRCEGKIFRLGIGPASNNSPAKDEAARVLEAIGGIKVGRWEWEFDYVPCDVIEQIISSGVIPDRVSHQYYPTPESIAEHLVECAEIGRAADRPTHSVLEPSAGQGAIVARVPVEDMECVEISPLHCRILDRRFKGTVKIHQADFLDWTTPRRFDRIVMNPPYSEGRAAAHVIRATQLLKPGGRLVTLLPAGFRNGNQKLPVGRWGRVFENTFTGTSIDVAVYIVEQES